MGVLGALRAGSGSGTFSSSSTTSMCTSPRTDSPLICVMRSPACSPASWAGLPSSTLWGEMARSAARRGSNSRRPHQAAATHADSVSLTLGAVQKLTRGERTGRALDWGTKDNSPTVRLPAGGISFMPI